MVREFKIIIDARNNNGTLTASLSFICDRYVGDPNPNPFYLTERFAHDFETLSWETYKESSFKYIKSNVT